MATPVVLGSPAEIPVGAHAVSLHVSVREAAHHAAEFLGGAPDGQAARFWVPDERSATVYAEAVAQASPHHVGCVAVLPTEQVAPDHGRLRPVTTIRAYLGEHPEGVTAAGGTLSAYLTAENGAAHAEYEAWFDEQDRHSSRFLCPYDLRRVPPEIAPEFLHDLGAHHGYVVLSHSDEPGARLLELFIFDSPDDVPDDLQPTLDWALDEGLVNAPGGHPGFALTAAGEAAIREWGERASLDY